MNQQTFVWQRSTPTTGPVLQRACACGRHSGNGGECAECRKKRLGLQRRARSTGCQPVAPPIVHDVLRSPGRPLDDATRGFMESRFNHDFSQVRAAAPRLATAGLAVGPTDDPFERQAERQARRVTAAPAPAARAGSSVGPDFSRVRVHTDSRAAESARAVDALAYTVGDHVVFGAGQYAPGTRAGRALLAHELTHVAQQGGAAERLQRDVAIEPVVTEPEIALARGEIVGALAHNRRWFTDRTLIAQLRDLLGIAPAPAVIDEEFVHAVARWQAANGITQDGRIGRITAIYLAEELEAEGLPLVAQRLRAALSVAARRGATVVDVDARFCDCRDELLEEITENLEFIAVYEGCRDDASNRNAGDIIACVRAHFAALGTPLSTAGTTSSSGQIRVAGVSGPCGPLLESHTFHHEWSHATTVRALERRHGQGTDAFFRAWDDPRDWANDEIRSRVVSNNYLLWLITRLDETCPAP